MVKEHGNDVDWKEVRERIKDIFLMARDRAEKKEIVAKGRKGRLQVCVMGPEEEDEEW